MNETQPLLANEIVNTTEIVSESSSVASGNVVDFSSQGDVDNPRDWPAAYKWSITALLAFTAFTTTFTCIGVVPIANRIVADLDNDDSNKSASVLLVTIWELGEAAGPLLIAPLSEIIGRYPVANGANIIFVLATALAALAPSANVLILARFLTGFSVAANVLNPAIVGDMFDHEHRGMAMSFLVLTPLIGGAIGPALSAAIAQAVGWRAVLWLCAILASASELCFLFCFKETYVVTILARRTTKLRATTGNQELVSALAPPDSEKKGKILRSVLRPFVVLFSSGVLQIMCAYGSLSFTYFYIMSTSLPDILEGIYQLSPTLTGICFISFSIGSIFSILICNVYLDKLYVQLRDRQKGEDAVAIGRPEYRLPLAIIGAFTMPIAVTLYGWSAQAALPLPLMLLATGVLGASLMLGFMPVVSYVVDAFGLYSASAMTALIVIRCLAGTFLPLTTTPLVRALGWGWAFTVFAGASLILAPVPVLVMRCGHKWRQRSIYTKDS